MIRNDAILKEQQIANDKTNKMCPFRKNGTYIVRTRAFHRLVDAYETQLSQSFIVYFRKKILSLNNKDTQRQMEGNEKNFLLETQTVHSCLYAMYRNIL